MGATGGASSADEGHRQRRNDGGKSARNVDSRKQPSEQDQRAADRGSSAEATPLLREKRRTPRKPEQPNQKVRDGNRLSTDAQPARPVQEHKRGTSVRERSGGTGSEQVAASQEHAAQSRHHLSEGSHTPKFAGRASLAKEAARGNRNPNPHFQPPTPPERPKKGKGNWLHRNAPGGNYPSRDSRPGGEPAREGRSADRQNSNRRGPAGKVASPPGRFRETHGTGRPGFGHSQQEPRPNGGRSGQTNARPIGFGAKNGIRHPNGSDAGLGFGRQDPARTAGSDSLPAGFGRANSANTASGTRSSYRGRPSRPDEQGSERWQNRRGRTSGLQGRKPGGLGPERR